MSDPPCITITKSGRRVQIKPADEISDAANINIHDIASHLAKACWLPNVPRHFYSVAQHCCLLADALIEHGALIQLFGLLYEAPAAYLRYWHIDQIAEMRVRIYRALGLPGLASSSYRTNLDTIISAAGAWLAETEARDLFTGHNAPLSRPFYISIRPWPWPLAEEQFLNRYRALCAAARIEDKS